MCGVSGIGVDGGDGVEDMHGIAHSMGSGDGVGGIMYVAAHSDDVGLVCVYHAP